MVILIVVNLTRVPFLFDYKNNLLRMNYSMCVVENNRRITLFVPVHGFPQQAELVDKPFIVTEYQQDQYWCETCQCFHTANLPTSISKQGLFGKNLTALTGCMKGCCRMSYTTIQDFLVHRGITSLRQRSCKKRTSCYHERSYDTPCLENPPCPPPYCTICTAFAVTPTSDKNVAGCVQV